MTVGINTRLLLKDKLEGIGWFTFENLKRITQNNPDVNFIFFFDREFDTEFIFSSNVKGVVLNPQARHPILFKIWFNWSIKRALKKYKVDLFLSPDGFLSLTSNIPSVAVIHDLNFEHYPEDLPPNIASYYTKYFPKFANKAKRIATVSEYSKQDIHEQYGIAKDKIDVVYNGVNDHYAPLDEKRKTSVKVEYTNGSEYFIYVGSLHKRKNINRLLLAFDMFKEKHQNDVKLVLVGEKMWKNQEFDSCLGRLKNKSDVIQTGRMSPIDLNQLLGASLALCYVPYFEGFGIPIIEGFKCETPVITSNVSSMPEVAGNAALLVNPFNIDEISAAMEKLYADSDLRQDLVAKGRARLQHFSWDKSASRLWKCMLKALDE